MRLTEKTGERVLGLFRMVVGLMFACHGAAALFDVLGGAHGRPPEFGEWPGWWAAFIQLVGGALVLCGMGTRVAALICSGSMAYAYFVKHQPDALLPIGNGGEAAAMFSWSFLLIAALGPGTWALVPTRGATMHNRRGSSGAGREPRAPIPVAADRAAEHGST